MESGELSTDREKSRVRLTGELQGPRHEHEESSPVKGVADATGSPSGDLGRQGLSEVLKRVEARRRLPSWNERDLLTIRR